MQPTQIQIDKIIDDALQEDVGFADITSQATIDPDLQTRFSINTRQQMIVCGVDVAKRVFQRIDESILIEIKIDDGKEALKDDVLISGFGNAQNIMQAERVALNLLRQMCGVATYANMFVQKVIDTNVKILDTRKF